MIFSRHAKRRMNLYQITEEDVADIIDKKCDELPNGEKFIIIEHLSGKFALPIKVVGFKTEGNLMIITAYPLKKKLGDR